MSAPAFDPVSFRDSQRHDWDEAAAAWEEWGQWIEEVSSPVTRRMLDLAAIETGHRVLDVACGAGDPALAVAAIVGPTGHVVGTDLSPAMIELARRRAAGAGLDNLSFQVSDVAELALERERFDRVLCRFGLMLFPDPAGAVRSLSTFLRPGGRFVAAVWAAPERVPFLALAASVIMKELQMTPPPPEAPGLFSLGDEARLEQVVRAGGFSDVTVEARTIHVRLESAERYTEMIRDVATVLRKLVDAQPAERQQAIWTSVNRTAQQRAAADGHISLPADVLFVTAIG